MLLGAFNFIKTKFGLNGNHPAPSLDEPQPQKKKKELEQKPQEKLMEIVSALYKQYSERRSVTQPLYEELERFINRMIEENLFDSLDFNEKVKITEKNEHEDLLELIFAHIKNAASTDDNYRTVFYCITEVASFMAEMLRNNALYILLAKIMNVMSFDHFAKMNITSRLRQLTHLHAKVAEPQVLEALLQKRPELYETLCLDDSCLMSIARAVNQYHHSPATLINTLKAFSIEKCIANHVVYETALRNLIEIVEIEGEDNQELDEAIKKFLDSYVTVEKQTASESSLPRGLQFDIERAERVLKRDMKKEAPKSDEPLLASQEDPEENSATKRMKC